MVLLVNGANFSSTLNDPSKDVTFYDRVAKKNVTYKVPTIRDSKFPPSTTFLIFTVNFTSKELLKYKNKNINFNFKFEGNLYNGTKPFSIPSVSGMSNVSNTIRMNVNFKSR